MIAQSAALASVFATRNEPGERDRRNAEPVPETMAIIAIIHFSARYIAR